MYMTPFVSTATICDNAKKIHVSEWCPDINKVDNQGQRQGYWRQVMPFHLLRRASTSHRIASASGGWPLGASLNLAGVAQ